jgi:hypothetical protein
MGIRTASDTDDRFRVERRRRGQASSIEGAHVGRKRQAKPGERFG